MTANIQNVIPMDDLLAHLTNVPENVVCGCLPTTIHLHAEDGFEYGQVVVHHSYDGREFTIRILQEIDKELQVLSSAEQMDEPWICDYCGAAFPSQFMCQVHEAWHWLGRDAA